MLEKLVGIFSKKQFSSIESSTLDLQKDLISYPALAIIRKLKRSGWEAFIVGGAVRDLLMNIKPKDFDPVSVITFPKPAPNVLPCCLLSRII